MAANGFPHAEELPNGRAGADIKGTPGVAIEVKTGKIWRQEWMRQAGKYDGRVKVVVWLRPGTGEKSISRALAIMPEEMMMRLLIDARRGDLSLCATRGIEWRDNWDEMTEVIIYCPPAPAGPQGIVQMHMLMHLLTRAGYGTKMAAAPEMV